MDQSCLERKESQVPVINMGYAGQIVQAPGDPRSQLPQCLPPSLPGFPYLNHPSL